MRHQHQADSRPDTTAQSGPRSDGAVEAAISRKETLVTGRFHALDVGAHGACVHDFAAARYDRSHVEPGLALEIQVAAYLMQRKDGRGTRLLRIGALAAWEAEYEHRPSSLLRTG